MKKENLKLFFGKIANEGTAVVILGKKRKVVMRIIKRIFFKIILVFLLVLILVVLIVGFYDSSPYFRQRIFRIKNIGIKIKKEPIGVIHYDCNGSLYGASLNKVRKYRFGFPIYDSLVVSRIGNLNESSNCVCEYVSPEGSKEIELCPDQSLLDWEL